MTSMACLIRFNNNTAGRLSLKSFNTGSFEYCIQFGWNLYDVPFLSKPTWWSLIWRPSPAVGLERKAPWKCLRCSAQHCWLECTHSAKLCPRWYETVDRRLTHLRRLVSRSPLPERSLERLPTRKKWSLASSSSSAIEQRWGRAVALMNVVTSGHVISVN